MPRLTKEQVDALVRKLKDPEDAKAFLIEAGLLDENGDLAKPYRLDKDMDN
jgi:hypothetical protein